MVKMYSIVIGYNDKKIVDRVVWEGDLETMRWHLNDVANREKNRENIVVMLNDAIKVVHQKDKTRATDEDIIVTYTIKPIKRKGRKQND